MQQPLSIRKMAEALGLSKSQVARDSAEGMPMASAEEARAWRLANHDISRTKEGRIDRGSSAAATCVQAPAAAESAADDDDSEVDKADEHTASYREHRAANEKIRVERAQIELDQLRGRLVDKTEVARLRFTEFRALRDRLGNVGTRIKDACAAETDPLKTEQLIDAEISAALTEFADTVLTRSVMQDGDDDEPD